MNFGAKSVRNLMKKYMPFLLVGLLAGCSTLDFYLTSFEPIDSQAGVKYYKFTSFASAEYPIDSKSAEEIRLEWLGKWAQENNINQNSLKVVDRNPIKISSGIFGDTYKIYYKVKVEDSPAKK